MRPRTTSPTLGTAQRLVQPNAAAGLGFMLGACVAFALASTSVKAASVYFGASFMLAALIRSAVGTVAVAPAAWRAGLGTQRPWLLLARAVSGTASMLGFFFALTRLPLGDAVMLAYSSPILVSALSPFVLGERPSRVVLASLAVAVSGMALLLRPTFAVWNPGGIAAVGAAVAAALSFLAVRSLSATEPPSRIVFWFNAVSSSVAALCLFAGIGVSAGSWLDTGPWGLGLLAAAGVGATTGQLLMTRAYSLEEAPTVSLYGYSIAVFSYGLQVVVFDEALTQTTVVGASLILGAGAAAALHTRAKSRAIARVANGA